MGWQRLLARIYPRWRATPDGGVRPGQAVFGAALIAVRGSAARPCWRVITWALRPPGGRISWEPTFSLMCARERTCGLLEHTPLRARHARGDTTSACATTWTSRPGSSGRAARGGRSRAGVGRAEGRLGQRRAGDRCDLGRCRRTSPRGGPLRPGPLPADVAARGTAATWAAAGGRRRAGDRCDLGRCRRTSPRGGPLRPGPLPADVAARGTAATWAAAGGRRRAGDRCDLGRSGRTSPRGGPGSVARGTRRVDLAPDDGETALP
ncbi:hypothetical protein SAMN05421684_1559 [Asanoa ishikariensis]|uniref:Uncharacterized protein n=1 Tax=Asanoa ishikariensis TaxID=137265 RepID=A0A1H3MR04_9ACTN|nr:hypothetical protein SAMN05421684_1559 [Asanoa ishikariensis]